MTNKHDWQVLDARSALDGFYNTMFNIDSYIGCSKCFEWRDASNTESRCNGKQNIVAIPPETIAKENKMTTPKLTPSTFAKGIGALIALSFIVAIPLFILVGGVSFIINLFNG